MATDNNTDVNAKITDAVTQTNVKVLSEAPAIAMGSLYQTIGNAVALAASNAVFAQQQANMVYQAATTMCIKTICGGAHLDDVKIPNNFHEKSSGILEEQINRLTKQLEKTKTAEKQMTKKAKTKAPEKESGSNKAPLTKSTTKKTGQ